jgi:hypothetical protein
VLLLLVQEAQKLVLEAIQTAAPDRDFEANYYFTMLQVKLGHRSIRSAYNPAWLITSAAGERVFQCFSGFAYIVPSKTWTNRT